MSGGQRGRGQAVQTGGRAGRRRCRDAARQEVAVAGRHFYQAVPHGLAVRIPGFHPGGPGSTPGVGKRCFLFRSPSCLAVVNSARSLLPLTARVTRTTPALTPAALCERTPWRAYRVRFRGRISSDSRHYPLALQSTLSPGSSHPTKKKTFFRNVLLRASPQLQG